MKNRSWIYSSLPALRVLSVSAAIAVYILTITLSCSLPDDDGPGEESMLARTNGLVAAYNLAGDGEDCIGTNHGTVYNAAVPTSDREGVNGWAVSFNGSNQYIEIPDHNLLSIATTGELTISIWMRPDVLEFPVSQGPPFSNYIHWMGKGVSGEHEYVLRMYNSNTYRPNRTSCYAFNANGNQGAGSYVQEAVIPGEWIHFVALYNYPIDTIQIYKNGVLRDTDTFSGYTITPSNRAAPLRIGTRDLGSYLLGAVDDLRIYNRALELDEITDLYNE